MCVCESFSLPMAVVHHCNSNDSASCGRLYDSKGGHSVLLLMFRSFFATKSPRSLGRSSPNFATCSMVTQIYEMAAPFARNLAAQKREISARFPTTSGLDHKFLRSATRHRQSENDVANYGHSCTGKLNLVYFGS